MAEFGFADISGDRDTDLDNGRHGDHPADNFLCGGKDDRRISADLSETQGSKVRGEGDMRAIYKIYIGIAVAVVLAIGIVGGSAWSDHRIRKLEAEVIEAKLLAEKSEKTSFESEKKAAEFAAKTEYLEGQMANIKTIARRQDEQLEKQNTNTRSARGDVERAKRTGSIDTGADELCTKLAGLGHPC